MPTLVLLDTSLTVGRPLALLLVGLMLALLGLDLWLLVDRARRRRAERELFARLVVLETDRARAQMAAAGGPAAPRGRGVTPPAGEKRAATPPTGRGGTPGSTHEESKAEQDAGPRDRASSPRSEERPLPNRRAPLPSRLS